MSAREQEPEGKQVYCSVMTAVAKPWDTGMNRDSLRRFFWPRIDRRFALRLAFVAASAYGLFGFVCIPVLTRGASMEPTYRDGRVNFCWRLRYAWSEPRVGDVVMVRFAGTRVMLLKRIVALAGDTVEFRGGRLLVNGVERAEPYLRYRGTWDLPLRTVEPGHAYVVGDNRGMPQSEHHFGQTPLGRIVGAPLW
jgi:signal peptidase I